MCDKVIESYNKEKKSIPTNFNEEKKICKTQNFYLLLNIAFLIAASIYCYLIKYQAIQKYLLSFQVANNELKDIMY